MARSGPPRMFMRAQWRLHKLIWNLSRGRLGRRIGGVPSLELITTGHKSGEPRQVLLYYVDDPGGPIVAGSNAGADRDPAWVQNLRATPSATVRRDGVESPVNGVILDGPQRESALATFFEVSEAYRNYDRMRTVPIAIVQLEPRS